MFHCKFADCLEVLVVCRLHKHEGCRLRCSKKCTSLTHARQGDFAVLCQIIPEMYSCEDLMWNRKNATHMGTYVGLLTADAIQDQVNFVSLLQQIQTSLLQADMCFNSKQHYRLFVQGLQLMVHLVDAHGKLFLVDHGIVLDVGGIRKAVRYSVTKNLCILLCNYHRNVQCLGDRCHVSCGGDHRFGPPNQGSKPILDIAQKEYSILRAQLANEVASSIGQTHVGTCV